MSEAPKHPNRQQALAMLRAADVSPEKLREWNEYRAQHPDWKPDLSHYFDRTDLHGLDLTEADLSETKLRHANLSGANFFRANLSGAELDCANLSGADLRARNSQV